MGLSTQILLGLILGVIVGLFFAAGSFYGPSLIAPAEVDLIDLYIPVNPFSSLARTVVPAAAVFSVVCGVALIGLGVASTALVGGEDIPRRTRIQLSIENPLPVVVRDEGTETLVNPSTKQNRPRQILARETHRVGYNPDGLPFVFVNGKGELVGFDIALMHGLAADRRGAGDAPREDRRGEGTRGEGSAPEHGHSSHGDL